MFARGTTTFTAAAICAGAFALMTQPSASEDTQAVAKINDRHPAYQAEVIPATYTLRKSADSTRDPQIVNAAAKTDMAPKSGDCAKQTWPRIDAACLTLADGMELRKNVRNVSISEDVVAAKTVAMRAAPTVTAAAQ